jgi:nicotinate-nucleotide pyrophosphorylase (carboxylating)
MSPATAVIIARAPGIIAGLRAVPELISVYARLNPSASKNRFASLDWILQIEDGARVAPDGVVATVAGPMRAIHIMERPILNLLGRLSGIATRTRQFVDALESGGHVGGRSVQILDTRKTTPGMRSLEKYAVRCGGGFCHRIGLHDAVLVKDNHLAGISVANQTQFLDRNLSPLKQPDATPLRFIEVEVDSLEQLEAVLKCAPGLVDVILLDNMPVTMLGEAVALRDRINSMCRLEASGGVSLESVASIASTGVERISTGAITHSANWLDLSLEIRDRT